LNVFLSIYAQYIIGTAIWAGLFGLLLFRVLSRKRPDRVILGLAAVHITRFAGAVAFNAVGTGPSDVPFAFALQVTIGDCTTALLAIATVVLLAKGTRSALPVALLMNLVGLADILVSESWIGFLELTGRFVRPTLIHGPSVGPTLMTALHLYGLYFLKKAKAGAPLGSAQPA
jgi:hypothetical protein